MRNVRATYNKEWNLSCSILGSRAFFTLPVSILIPLDWVSHIVTWSSSEKDQWVENMVFPIPLPLSLLLSSKNLPYSLPRKIQMRRETNIWKKLICTLFQTDKSMQKLRRQSKKAIATESNDRGPDRQRQTVTEENAQNFTVRWVPTDFTSQMNRWTFIIYIYTLQTR